MVVYLNATLLLSFVLNASRASYGKIHSEWKEEIENMCTTWTHELHDPSQEIHHQNNSVNDNFE